MAQVKAKQTKQIFFSGVTSTIIEGTIYDSESRIVKSNPDLFEISKEEKSVKKEVIVEVVESVEAPQEELLVEAPVAALEVEEVVETLEVAEAPKETKTENKKGNRK